MNRAFAEATTSVAFALMLTKTQCNALLRLEGDQKGLCFHTVGTMHTLESRGLVSWKRDPDGKANGFEGLTDTGRVVCQLLKHAGLTIDNTNSVSVLKRLGWEAERKTA